jgi:hypothetical protein
MIAYFPWYTTRTQQKTTPPILRWHGNVFTKLLPSRNRNDIHVNRWMGGIYDLCRWDGYHDTYVKCHKDWFKHSEADREVFTNIQTHTDSTEIAEVFFIFRNKESRLKMKLNRIPKQALKYKPSGRRDPERPKTDHMHVEGHVIM